MRFLFELLEGMRIAARAIRVNKMRSILTTLGIIIGILAVTLMATVVNGIERGFEADMERLGTDVVYIEKWPWNGGPGFKWWEYINRPNMTPDLADAIDEHSRYTVASTPLVETRRSVRYKGTTLNSIGTMGIRASYTRIFSFDLSNGRFFDTFDNRTARPVAVIGAAVADELFPLEEPVGKYIRIGGNRVQVIGVREREGSSMDEPDGDDQKVLMPYNTFKKFFGTSRRNMSIQAKIVDPAYMEEAVDELTGILRVARRLDAKDDNNFEINEQQTLRAQIAPVKATIYSIGIGLTALSLLVGGIGVMNIMFVSVKERTREIGIRKAVGARRRTILMQFLIEAVLVCSLGGLVGILLSLPLVLAVRTLLPATLDGTVILIAFAICSVIGIVFGLAPAWSASRAQPIEALRYE